MRYKMTIEPITFVHIGSGSEIDPFNYTMIDKKFYRIDIAKFYEKLKSDKFKDKFENLIEELSNSNIANSLNNEVKEKFIQTKNEFINFLQEGIKTLLKNSEKQKGIILYSAKVDENLFENYKLNINNFENQLLIFESMHRLPDYAQYIPGSSIKGALRTAIISYIINDLQFERSDFPFNDIENKNFKKNPGRACEQEILNYFSNIQKDPFRVLKISDTEPFEKDSIFIAQTTYCYKGTNRFSNLQIISEYILNGNSSSFILDINEKFLDNKIKAISLESKKKNNKAIKFNELFSIQKIAEACNKFYIDKLENDYNKYFQQIADKVIDKEEIKSKVDTKNNEFLIRIGRFSQFESVTLDKLRSKNNIFNSRMLVLFNDKYYPAGWSKVKWETL